MQTNNIDFNSFNFKYEQTNVLVVDFPLTKEDYDKLPRPNGNTWQIIKGKKHLFWLTVSELPEEESGDEFILSCLTHALGENKKLLDHLNNLIEIYNCIQTNNFESIPLRRTFGRKYRIARWIDYYDIFFWSGIDEMYFEFTTPISIIDYPNERFVLDYKTAGRLFINFLSEHINFVNSENPDDLTQTEVKEILDKFIRLQILINLLFL